MLRKSRKDTSVEYLKTLMYSPNTSAFSKYFKAGGPPRLSDETYLTSRGRKKSQRSRNMVYGAPLTSMDHATKH